MRDHWYYGVDPKYLAYLKSKEWLGRRAQVIKRCHNTCERCGKFSVSEVHHITYSRIFCEELSDLQGLCTYCHAFLHGECPNDGITEHERQERQRDELRTQVDSGLAELRRFEEVPHFYRSFVAGSMPEHRELIRLLKQHPRVITAYREREIFDVRYAKRKYRSAVAFKLKWDLPNGHGWARVRCAEEWLRGREVVFDFERQLWVDVRDIRWFVTRYSTI
jgi:hypothetical protein